MVSRAILIQRSTSSLSPISIKLPRKELDVHNSNAKNSVDFVYMVQNNCTRKDTQGVMIPLISLFVDRNAVAFCMLTGHTGTSQRFGRACVKKHTEANILLLTL